MKVWTARYRYEGEDRLDITVKGRGKAPVGRYFAPLWETVMALKEGMISEKEYKEKYIERMRMSYRLHREVWNEVLSRESVTLVCFCEDGAFCHRYILAELLEKCGAKYMGKRG